MAAKSLQEILKSITKEFGEGTIQIGVPAIEDAGVISLGSPSFDFCLYGGLPKYRMIEFSGAEGSGKTTAAFLAAASYQREEKKQNPDNPRAVVYVDNEGTLDKVWAKKMGFDVDDEIVPTAYFTPEGQSAEKIFDRLIDLIESGEVGLIIIDSLATLIPMQLEDESMEKQQMGGIAKSLTRFSNAIIGLLRKYKVTLIAINQVRENISGYGDPLITNGGRAWKHNCSVRLMFKKGDFFDAEGNVLPKKAESPAGQIMEVSVLKTKVSKWDRKLGRMHLSYTQGVDIMQDTIETAVHLGLIDNSVQGSYKLIDVKTGEPLLDSDGNPVKIRGKNNIKPYFEEHLDVYRKLYDKVYEKLSQKDDPFIKSFEEMLNVNVADKFGIDFSNSEEL